MNKENIQFENSITTSVQAVLMQKIQNGEVSMKPKAYFVFSTIAFVLLSIFILITTVFLISYTLFNIVISGHLLLLGFGLKGVVTFILLFPWYIFLIDILLISALDVFVRKFKFGYNRPVAFVFFGITILMILAGYAVSVTSLHKKLLYHTEHKEFPLVMGRNVGSAIEPLYGHVRESHRDQGVIQGTVTSVSLHSFTIHPDVFDTNLHEATTTIFAPMNFPVNVYISLGNHVLIAGEFLQDGNFNAYGITRFGEK